jgi:8-oxo-dGTP diphosphatase
MTEHTRVGVAIIVVKDGRVLMLKRKNVHGAGCWSTPGGHLDYGETPEQCAARETLEETGVTIGNARFRALTNDVFEERGWHYVTIWMEGDYISGEATVAADYEASEVGWFAWDALPQPLFLPLRHLLVGQCCPPPE